MARLSAGRLWNPTNSTPRTFNQPQAAKLQTRRRKDSESAEVIAVPLHHPDIGSPKLEAAAGGEYPLLTLPEQRQKRHSASTRASLQVDRSGSSSGSANRISLPRSVSIDLQRRSGELSPKIDKGKGKAVEEDHPEVKKVTGIRKRGQSISRLPAAGISFDTSRSRAKGKEPATMMSTDLERGPAQVYNANGRNTPKPHNPSNASNASLSPTNTSIMGDDVGPLSPSEEWGPQHPCYPHLNPHVPRTSPLYRTTRIIRIRRDWMIEGDLAPTFSNLYPAILDPAGVSEQDFRTLIARINKELIRAFKPDGWRNVFDGIMGVITGWVWDDMGFAQIKGSLRKVEGVIEQWNREKEGKAGREELDAGLVPRVVSLRRSGYMAVCLPSLY